jgi:hypothetical protein
VRTVDQLHARGANFVTDGWYDRRCSNCHVPVHFNHATQEWEAGPNRVSHYINVCPRGDTTNGWGSHYVNLDF